MMRLTLKALIVLLTAILLCGCSTVKPTPTSTQTATTTPGTRPTYEETGKASFYAEAHQSKKTASGEIFDHKLLTAAHRTLPLGLKVQVTNINNGKSVVVKINDRGPFIKNRILDLSKSAFDTIADVSTGIIDVKIEAIE